MTIQKKMLPIIALGVLATGLCCAPGVWAQSASPPQDHTLLYKRAVSLLDKAQKKLAANYTAEAKAMVKEANALFSTLQKEKSRELSKLQLTTWQKEQEAVNKRLAADSYAQGERHENSARQKEAKSRTLESQGQDQLSIKYLTEAKREYDLAHKMYVKSEIYSLRNQQLRFSFIKNSP